jgi:hypothetical protein
MGIGIVAGYFIAKRHLEEDVEILIEDTVQLTFKFEEEEAPVRPLFVINEHDLIISDRNTTITDIDEEDLEGGEESMINVFAEADEDWDYEYELSMRLPHIPYTIHRDEFFADEMGWDSQSTLTWYEGDEVLVDELNNALTNAPAFIGNPTFGHGSGDPNVVYVRNEKFQAEYEVLRDPGSYEIEVLGLHMETEMEKQDFRHARSPGKFPRE